MADLLKDFLPILVVGISLGSLYGLVGLGFTVIINASQLVNFAQGDFAMLGVAVCWFCINALGLPLWLAFPLAVMSGGLYGLLTDKAIVSPLLKRDAPPFSMILGTMAMGTIAAGAVGIYTGFWWMPIEHFMGSESLVLMGLSFDTQGAIIIFVTIMLVIGYWLLLNKTRLGTALRATGYNREVSILLGIQTSKMVAFSFILAGTISATVGVLCAPLSAFTATDGLPLAINGFISLIVGGWGNPYAAVLGGVSLGIIRAILTGYFSSAHAELGTFFVLLVVLILKPSGLFSGFMIPKGQKDLSR